MYIYILYIHLFIYLHIYIRERERGIILTYDLLYRPLSTTMEGSSPLAPQLLAEETGEGETRPSLYGAQSLAGRAWPRHLGRRRDR